MNEIRPPKADPSDGQKRRSQEKIIAVADQPIFRPVKRSRTAPIFSNVFCCLGAVLGFFVTACRRLGDGIILLIEKREDFCDAIANSHLAGILLKQELRKHNHQ